MIQIRLVFFAAFCLLLAGCSAKPKEIIVCGDDKVLIIDRVKSDSTNVVVTWQWMISETDDLPVAYQKYMIPTDDCKPVDNNTKILITSSGGGVVLVDRATKKTLFYAYVPNAHSAELLPNDRIVVALSTAEGGNSIQLFNINKPEEVIFSDSLYSGHGVVYMEEMKLLFALGYDELRSYSLVNWDSDKPELKLDKMWKLPDESGHDLSRVTDKSLVLSTHHSAWIFDIGSGQFSPFEMLRDVENLKSVNYNVSSDELIYTKGEISWWTHNVYCKNPDKTITLPDVNLYKARVIHW